MSRTQEQNINFIKAVLQDHKDYWNEQMPLLRRYRDAYENKFWSGINAVDDGMIRIETSDTFAYIEGFLLHLVMLNYHKRLLTTSFTHNVNS